jgi:hypothetical protein
VARATGFEAQKEALGETATALVAVANAVADGHINVVPEVLVTGGGGSFEGLAAQLIRHFGGTGGTNGAGRANGLAVAAPVEPPSDLSSEVSPEAPSEAPFGVPDGSVEVAGDGDDRPMGGAGR